MLNKYSDSDSDSDSEHPNNLFRHNDSNSI